MIADLLPGIEPTDAEWIAEMSSDELAQRAVVLLQVNEPQGGYWLGFSGGKDSCVIDFLAKLAGVKFEKHYNQTTIDAPEAVRFIKQKHPDAIWNRPAQNMMHRVENSPKVPPTRLVRWCCDEYKEQGGKGRVRIVGVRKDEGTKRARRWTEVVKHSDGGIVICPIVHWSNDQLWKFIRENSIEYCELYDQGFERLGCVGCPLTALENQRKEFDRWPMFERNWKKAIVGNWEKFKDQLTEKGKPRFQSKFKTGEDFWQWWLLYGKKRRPEMVCQNQLLLTNE